MKIFRLSLVFVCLFSLTSCLEIVDDLKINPDGSGSLSYNINLSASKVKINSIFALDSLNGKKVPTRDEIRGKILAFKDTLLNQDGIVDVSLEMDFENYLFKWKVDFEQVAKLQDAVLATAEKMGGKKEWLKDETEWLTFADNKLTRSIPEIKDAKLKSIQEEERQLLKEGSYISITRFQQPVLKFDNEQAVLSKNKMAVMVRTDAFSLSQDFTLLENVIYLGKAKP